MKQIFTKLGSFKNFISNVLFVKELNSNCTYVNIPIFSILISICVGSNVVFC